MKTSATLPLVGILTLSIAMAASAYCPTCPNCKTSSAIYGGSGTTMTPAKKVSASLQLTIASVADNSITVKGRKSTQTYRIDSKTHIRVDGRGGNPADLKPGMVVQVDAGSSYPQVAYSIAATSSSK